MPHLSPTISRISRRVCAGVALAALSVTALAGCSGSGDETTASDGTQQVSVQLGWLPNVENMPMLLAQENGHFAEQGLDVEVLPGGPDVNMDAQIAGGNALVGLLSAEIFAKSVQAGSGLVAIGAEFQTSTSAIVTSADSGINEPKDLEGKKLGMSQTDMPVYPGFFNFVGVNMDNIEQVMTGSDPASLASGEVDAITGSLANQPVVLEEQGFDVKTIPLGDYGYNRWSGVIVVRESSLADETERAEIISVLKAMRAGAEDAVADPQAGAQQIYDAYGQQLGLDLESQQKGAEVWAEILQTNTEDTGLLKVDDASLADLQTFYDANDIKVQATDIFDLSVGEEAFA